MVPLLTILSAPVAIVLSRIDILKLTTAESIIIALLALLAVDALSERIGLLERIETHLVSLGDKIESRTSADKLFLPRDELPSFESHCQKGEDIWVAGRSLRGLLNNHGKDIQAAAKSGKRFRFLIVDPDKPTVMDAMAAGSYTHPTGAAARQMGREALDHLKRLIENTPADAVEVRLTDHIPTCVYFIIDGEKPRGELYIEMYGYKISPSQRFHVHLTRSADHRTFASYFNQLNSMWQNAKPWPSDKG